MGSFGEIKEIKDPFGLGLRIHTDSITVKDKPTDILTGDKLGYLKLEYEGPLNLTGLNKFGEEYKTMKKEYKGKLNKLI